MTWSRWSPKDPGCPGFGQDIKEQKTIPKTLLQQHQRRKTFDEHPTAKKMLSLWASGPKSFKHSNIAFENIYIMDPNSKPSDILMDDTRAEVIDLATHLPDAKQRPAASLPVGAALLSALGFDCRSMLN